MDEIPNNRKMVTPGCCKEADEKFTVCLNFSSDDIYENPEGQKNKKPRWVARGWNYKYNCVEEFPVTFCPHCGKKIP